MPRAAIIGCGDVSVIHAEALSTMADAELVGVCDTHPDRLGSAVRAHGVPGFADHIKLLDSARPDVVHICTPHSEHARVAVDCLDRGVNVIVEKPVAHTLAEAERLIAAADRSTAKIAVCFQNRYNTASQAMHAMLASGELGAVLGASATVLWHRAPDYYLDRAWRGTWAGSGGGVMMNQAIHTVDLLQWLMGDVTAVSGHASSRFLGSVIEVEDTAEFAATHAAGSRSVLYATVGHVVNAPVSLEVVTEQATLRMRGDLTVAYRDGRRETVREREATSGGRAYWGVSHELLIRDFYAHLNSAEPFWIGPREGYKSLKIVKSVYFQSYPDMLATVS
jgi:UDP-N-acetyl-2-amino-2-deoxyglucuronate dehydrogenase